MMDFQSSFFGMNSLMNSAAPSVSMFPSSSWKRLSTQSRMNDGSLNEEMKLLFLRSLKTTISSNWSFNLSANCSVLYSLISYLRNQAGRPP